MRGKPDRSPGEDHSPHRDHPRSLRRIAGRAGPEDHPGAAEDLASVREPVSPAIRTGLVVVAAQDVHEDPQAGSETRDRSWTSGQRSPSGSDAVLEVGGFRVDSRDGALPIRTNRLKAHHEVLSRGDLWQRIEVPGPLSTIRNPAMPAESPYRSGVHAQSLGLCACPLTESRASADPLSAVREASIALVGF